MIASRAVYISPDDAKTDVILAAAVAVLGVSLRAFVVQLPLYPAPGLIGALLDLAWIVAITALVPWLLARYRGDGLAAFGITGSGGVAAGVLVAVPVAVLGVLVQVLYGSAAGVLLGRVAAPAGATIDVVDVAIGVARVALLSLGAIVLVGFLTVRAREAFPRSPDTHLTQLLRTAGLGAMAVAAVGGLLGSIGRGPALLALLNVLALVAVVLLADRLVPAGITVPRTTVIVPVVVVVVGKVFATGGLFFGDLIGGLTTGALALGVTLAIAGLSQTRRGTAAAIPVVIAVHWWPTCLSPVVLAGGLC